VVRAQVLNEVDEQEERRQGLMRKANSSKVRRWHAVQNAVGQVASIIGDMADHDA
jgi:hypothetical protein